MDNLPTQQPSAQPAAPVAATPAPATVVPPEATPTPTPTPPTPGALPPPSSNKTIFIAVAAVIALVLAYLGYTMLSAPSTATQEDEKISSAPPSLSMPKSGLKGSFSDVDSEYGFMDFNETDVKNFKAPPADTTAAELESGANYVYTTKDMTWKEIAQNIDPVAKKAFLAYYDTSKGKFRVYPRGPFEGTLTVTEPDLSTEKIPAGRGLIVISRLKSRAYGLANAKTKPTITITPVDSKLQGWILLPVKDAKIKEASKIFNGMDKTIFAQKSASEFEKVTNRETHELKDFNLLWVYLKKTDSVTGGSSTETTKTATIKTNSLKPITLNASGATTTQTQDVTLEGENLDTVDTITSSDSGIAIKSIVVTATKVTFKMEVGSSAKEGEKVLTLNGKDGKVITTLKVTASAPAATQTTTTLAALKITSPVDKATIDVTKDVVLSWEAATTLPVGTTALYLTNLMEGTITTLENFKPTLKDSETDKTTVTIPKDAAAKAFLPGKSYTFGVKVSAIDASKKSINASNWSLVTFSVAAAAGGDTAPTITLKTATTAPQAITFTSPKDKDSFKVEDLKKTGLTFTALDPNKESYNLNKSDKKTYFMNYLWSLKSKSAKPDDPALWSAGWEYDATKMNVDAKCLATFASDSKNYMVCPSGTIPASVFTTIVSGDYILTGTVGDGNVGTPTSITITITNNDTPESRDQKRLADLQAIKKAIDASYTTNKKYPDTVASTYGIPSALNVPAKDSDNKPYYYRNIENVCYVLGALMELEKNGHTGLPAGHTIDKYIGNYTCDTGKDLVIGKGKAYLSFTTTPDPIVTKISPEKGIEPGSTKVSIEGKNLDPKTLEVLGKTVDGQKFVWLRNNATGTGEKVEFAVGSTAPGAKPGKYTYQITMSNSKGEKITLKEFDFTIEAMKTEIATPIPSEIDPMTDGTISIKGKNFAVGTTIVSAKEPNDKLQMSVNGYYNTETELVFDYKDTGATAGDHIFNLEFQYKDGTAYKGEFTIKVNENKTKINLFSPTKITITQQDKNFTLNVTGEGLDKINSARLYVGSSYYDLEISEKKTESATLKGELYGAIDKATNKGTVELGVDGKKLAEREIEIEIK